MSQDPSRSSSRESVEIDLEGDEDALGKAWGIVDHVSSELLEKDLFELVSVFRSQAEIRAELADNELGSLLLFDGLFAQRYVIGHFIRCAISLRMLDDAIEEHIPNMTKSVGSLRPDFDSNIDEKFSIDKTALPLREACNKIIHANKIDFDSFEIEDQRGRSRTILNPYIYIYGNKGKKSWKARLNVKSFVAAGKGVIDHQQSMRPY